MNLLLEKSDAEIFELAEDWWKRLIKYSNNKNYLMFIENFSHSLRDGANEMEMGKQFARSDLAQNLSDEFEMMGTIRRGDYITVVIKQKHKTKEGEWLGRMVLGIEDDEVKIFGVSLF